MLFLLVLLCLLRHSTIPLVAYDRDNEIVYKPLHEVRLSACTTIAATLQGGTGTEEESDANNIVLMRHGAFCRPSDRRTSGRREPGGVFLARLDLSRESSVRLRRSRHGLWFRLAFSTTSSASLILQSMNIPISRSVLYGHLRQQHLLASSRAGAAARVCEIIRWSLFGPDVTALQLVADVLESAFVQGGEEKPKRKATDADHRANRGGQDLSRHA